MQVFDETVAGIILAAGKGTRMGSDLPKVLCQLAGRSLVERVYDTLKNAGISDICIVVSEPLAPFEPFLASHRATVCIQEKRQGTGDAVAASDQAFRHGKKAPYCSGRRHSGPVLEQRYGLVCYGDTPCLSPEIINDFISKARESQARLAVIGMHHPEPFGYGRLHLDDKGKLTGIIEEKDADAATKRITLCNSGIVFAEVSFLFELLSRLDNKNSQGEYYLTDCFKLSRAIGEEIFVYTTDQYRTFDGVNTKEQLASLEAWYLESHPQERQ